MSAQLRELRRRINATQSIEQITRAMERVAAARIGKARVRAEEARPYAEEMTRILTEVASSAELYHPLLLSREGPQRAAILMVTSDRGLCGGYNHDVLRAADGLRSLLREQGKAPVLYVIGRKGVNYYRFHDVPIAGSWTGFSEKPGYTDATAATRTLLAAFIAGHDRSVEGAPGVDEVHLVYTRFENKFVQRPRTRRIAPLAVVHTEDGHTP